MKSLFLLSALPGSGKSTWANAFVKEHPNTFIVASDEIRKSRFGAVNCFDHEKEVWDIYLSEIQRLGASEGDINVIADSTNLENKYRKYYAEVTPEFDRHVLVLFDIPFEVCLAQNKLRSPDRVVPDYAMKRLKAAMEEITPEIRDLYDEVIIVDKNYKGFAHFDWTKFY